MTSKTIIIGLVALAFVTGSIMTGTMADAAKGESNGQPFKQLQEQVDLLFVMIEDTAPILLIDEERDARVEADLHLQETDIALALDRDNGDAFLQGQIDAIELTPGPQGEQGIQGEQGPITSATLLRENLSNTFQIPDMELNEIRHFTFECPNNGILDGRTFGSGTGAIGARDISVLSNNAPISNFVINSDWTGFEYDVRKTLGHPTVSENAVCISLQ